MAACFAGAVLAGRVAPLTAAAPARRSSFVASAPVAPRRTTHRLSPPAAAAPRRALRGARTYAIQFLKDLMGSGVRKPDAEERTDLPAPAVGVTPQPGRSIAVAAGGCFWSVELAFQRTPGVTRTAVGYCQGATPNPTYESVCSGRTGHTEAVLIEYDPAVVSYDSLCDVLWSKIDATQANGQGGDIGSQYRTGLYYTDDAQRATAIASRAKEQARLGRTVMTEVMPAQQWYDAEKYHQSYLAKGGRFGRAQSAEKGCNDPIRCYG